MHTYEIRPRKDGRGFDLISDVLPSGRLWYWEARQAIDFAKHQSRLHDAVTNVYDANGETNPSTQARGRFQRAVTRETKSRHAVKRDG